MHFNHVSAYKEGTLLDNLLLVFITFLSFPCSLTAVERLGSAAGASAPAMLHDE